METLLDLDSIRRDGGTQPRAGIDYDAVDDYTEAMLEGIAFPSVVVFYDGSNYWLADGFHRFRAAEHAGANQIVCEIHQGTQQDAQWYSFSANKTNGLRRTNEDKQRAVKAAITHPNATVLSNRQIATHVGVDEGTVRNWREKLTAEIPQSPTRTGRDGRTINVTNIGSTVTHPLAQSPNPAPADIPALVPSTASASAPPTTPTPAVAPPPAVAPTQLPAPAPMACEAAHMAVSQAPQDPGPASVPIGNESRMRVIRACMEIANCPVSATELAILIAQSEDSNQHFSNLEKAHEILTDVIRCRR